jgi:hypothetical protein
MSELTGEAMYLRRLIAIASLIFAANSCSSSLEPRSGVRLLVTNATCAPGPCSAQEVLAFPSNQPETPGGDWSIDLGTMTGPQLCVTIPLSATFTVAGPGDVTEFVWNTAKPVSLGVRSPSDGPLQASPSTPAFVPAAAAGWSITLPGQAQPVQGAACTP